MTRRIPLPRTLLAACLLGAALAAPARQASPDTGYLAAEALPDGVALVPPPPAPGSAEEARDQAHMQAALALRDRPRFAQARADADLDFPQAAALFECALGVPVDAQRTPATLRLLQRSLVDAARSTRGAKQKYQRPRPFLANGAPTCTPEEEASLRDSGSYPSGHAAIGWAWALTLAAAAPERGDALLARGREFGDSRVLCNVHWRSDVEQGQLLGTATFLRLLAEPAFRADLEAATTELAALRRAGATPARACPVPAALAAL